MNIKITKELFFRIVKYFILDDCSEENKNAIIKELNNKIDSLIKHELYTEYKMSDTEEKREIARQKYLDSVGIHKDFRW